MSKLNRLSPSGIEYLDYAWNFYSGCRHKEQGKCPPYPCWAGQFTGRFKKTHYKNGFNPTFYPEAFLSPLALKKPSRIGVCFMGDLFGDWIDPEKIIEQDITKKAILLYPDNILKNIIFTTIKQCPRHTFIFLTKNPAGLMEWSPFPDNCWVGFSAWSPESFIEGLRHLSKVEAKVKWCSLEPLLEWETPPVILPVAYFSTLDWVALGGLTGTKGQINTLAPMYPALTPFKLGAGGNRWGLMPPVAWLKNIVESCDASQTKVFLKDNLWKWLVENAQESTIFNRKDKILAFKYHCTLRQECGPSARLGINVREKRG